MSKQPTSLGKGQSCFDLFDLLGIFAMSRYHEQKREGKPSLHTVHTYSRWKTFLIGSLCIVVPHHFRHFSAKYNRACPWLKDDAKAEGWRPPAWTFWSNLPIHFLPGLDLSMHCLLINCFTSIGWIPGLVCGKNAVMKEDMKLNGK